MWSDNPVHSKFTAGSARFPAEANHHRTHKPAAVSSITDTASVPSNNIKPRPERACDLCRRRKTKCDGPSAPDNVCTNCVQNNQSCTYLEASRPRGPPKAYVSGLEDRLERMEALLRRLRPEVDLAQHLGPPIIRDSWKSGTHPSTTASKPLVKKEYHPTSLNPLDHSLRAQRKSSDVESEDPLSTDDEDPPFECAKRKLNLRTPGYSDDETDKDDGDTGVDPGTRLYGKSADIHLVGPTMLWKYLHIKEVSPPDPQPEAHPSDPGTFPKIRRPIYWGPPFPWELEWEGVNLTNPAHFRSVRDTFPSPDLAEELIDLYFTHVNVVYPLFHRPTFDDHWNEGLQYRDICFTSVCMLVFAVASRWSADPRVLGELSPAEPGQPPRYRRAGWHFFSATIELFTLRRSILLPATLFELQLHCLIFMYLRYYLPQGAAWAFNSIGLRKAQDVGIHRGKLYEKDPNAKDELWKRVLWTMVGFDREGSVDVGRSCALREEDMDVDPPLVVDDECWATDDPESAFRQPPGKPSHMEAFGLWLKLTKISAFAVRTLYAVDKSKVAPAGITTSEWRERTVAQLNAAMSHWVDSLPDHLRWSPNMGNRVFATQSATLFLGYYLNQILIYRPFIPSVKSDAAAKTTPSRIRFPFPALPICLNAARTAIQILEAEKKTGFSNIPIIIRACQEAGGILITHVWRLKSRDRALALQGIPRRYSGPLIADLVADVQKVIDVLDGVCDRWPLAYSLATHFRGSLPGEGEDEVEVPLSQPSPMANPEEDEGVETVTRFNILSYPLFTIDGAAEDAYDSSDPSKSGSGSPSFNPRPWAQPPSSLEKPGHTPSYSVVAQKPILRQRTTAPVYPSGPCTPPSPHYNYDPFPEGHRPISHLPEYVNGNHGYNHGYQGHLHEGVKPFIKQEYVEDNQLISGLPDPMHSYVAGHNQPMKPAHYW